MNPNVRQALERAVLAEPFAVAMKIELKEMEDGYSLVEMIFDPARQNNLYERAHGGAIYGLIDEAFEIAGQTDGTIAVALNVNVTYIASPNAGDRLQAEAKRISQTKKTASYDIKVINQDGKLIATCQALAFRTGKAIPFL